MNAALAAWALNHANNPPMNLDLSGKRALVCGSTQGIGRAAAEAMAALGAEIVLLARDAAKLQSVKAALPKPKGQSHEHLVADFNDPASVGAAIDAIASGVAKPCHILINNTGGPPGGTAIDAPLEQYLAAFRAHLLCGQTLVQGVVPGMKKAGYGRIINIISTSVKAPIPGLGVSNTIRGAVASWAKTLASELGPSGITVNNVLPGFTSTERLSSLIQTRASKGNKTEDAVAAEMRATIPLGRFAKPEEVGDAIAFLAAPAAGYISGINLPVDGGRLPTL